MRLLEQACAAYGHEDPFALGTRLRRTYPADLVATPLTQAELRAKATVRFDPADAANTAPAGANGRYRETT